MLGDFVTVLWTIDNSSAKLARQLDSASVELVRLDSRELVPAVVAALARSAVVAVVDDAENEKLALGMGVDEVLRTTQLEEPGFARLLERARLRANARELRERFMADQATHDGTSHMMLLGAAIAHDMNSPLAVASLNAEVVQLTLTSLLDLLEEVKANARCEEAMPSETVRRLLAARMLEPPRAEILAAVDDLRAALRDAAMIVVRMTALTDTQPAGETVDLSAVLAEFSELVRGEVERVASFVVDVPHQKCLVDIPKGWALQIAAALVANSLEAVTELPRKQGRIALGLVMHEEVCVIEVRDNGIGMTPDVRRRAVEPFFTTRRPGALGLGLTMVIAQARRVGGEVLTDSEPGLGSVVRVFLPTAGARSERMNRTLTN